MSWTERQGQVGDLSGQSREELREILSRQQHILDNKRFIQKLPDKGKKISEFAERVRLAIARHEEQERKQDALSFTEFQNKYQQAFSQHQRRGAGVAFSQHPRGAGPGVVHGVSPAINHNGLGEEDEDEEEDAARDGQTMETAGAVTTGGVSLPLYDGTEESELAEALGRVSLSHANANAAATGSSAGSASAAREERKEDAGADGAAMNNYFLGKHPQQQEKKKAHYMEVLAKNEHNQILQRHKFRPNQLGPSSRGDSPSGGSLSPAGRASPSGGGRSSPGGGLLSPSPVLSVQERKERDRKHLDDITAARLPLLHCEPARLLSMTESAELLVTQTRRQQELQAKQAAQKLSEGLMKSSAMGTSSLHHHRDEGPTVGSSYHHLHHPYGGPTHHQHPDGGPTTAAYREEVHQHHDDDDDDDDDGAGLSSEED